MEVYEEQSVVNEGIDKNKRKRLIIRIIRYACIVAIVVMMILSWMHFLNLKVDAFAIGTSLVFYVLLISPFAVTHFILGRIVKNASMEFDYYINGDIFRIVKVINRQRRKLMTEFNVSSIESVGRITSEAYDRYAGFKNIKKLMAVCDVSDENEIYYIFYKAEGLDNLLHFQPNALMKTAIKKGIGRISIIDKSFFDAVV